MATSRTKNTVLDHTGDQTTAVTFSMMSIASRRDNLAAQRSHAAKNDNCK